MAQLKTAARSTRINSLLVQYLVGERAHWGAEGPRQPEVGDLESAVAAHEQVLGLQVPSMRRVNIVYIRGTTVILISS